VARPLEFDREEVLARALQVFWTYGYKNTSMEKLVSELGVNRASVYGTFGNKRELFTAALHHYANDRIPQTMTLLKSDGRPEELLSAFFYSLIELGGANNHYRGCFVIGSLSELTTLEPEIAKLCQKTLAMLEKQLCRIVERGQKSGEIRNDVAAPELTTMLVSSAIGLVSKARNKESQRKLKTSADIALRLLRPLHS
jgi:TetR/AcrR family transcriptional repressor of nem operon